MWGVQQHLHNTWAVAKADNCIYTLCQYSHVTNNDYLKHFDLQVTVLETFGGELPKYPLLVKQKLIEAGARDPNNASDPEQKRA